MSIECHKFGYPGADAKPLEVLRLAEEYRRAAQALLPLGRRGQPDCSDAEREMLADGLRAYCERDTWAMIVLARRLLSPAT